MDRSIQINLGELTSLAGLKGKQAIACDLKIDGDGSIFFCILNFYNEGQHRAEYKDVSFKSEGLQKAKELRCQVPDFPISNYDYCRVELLTGWVYEGSSLRLAYDVS